MEHRHTPFEMLSDSEKSHVRIALKNLNYAQTHLLQAFSTKDCPDYLVEEYDAVGDLINGIERYIEE